METEYHTIIAGGGPAGLQCGRTLSKLGYKVLLLERSSIPGEPNFSTGWTPPQTITTFDLPQEVIGDSFTKVTVVTPNFQKTWEYKNNAGYVLKFNVLKKFLAKDIENNGGIVMWGATVEDIKLKEDNTIEGVYFSTEKEKFYIKAKYFIDASGEKAILATKAGLRNKSLGHPSVGVEKIIEADLDKFHKNNISIYLGNKFIPHGYGWTSSFGENRYKVGVCIADLGWVKLNSNIENYFINFLNTIGIKEYKQIEEHGGTIFVTGGFKNNVFQNLIMIGDAGSCINPILGEGVRHALFSGKFAAETIDIHEKGKVSSLKDYNKKLDLYRGNKWNLSRKFVTILYHKLNDKGYDIFAKRLGRLTPEELFDFGYNYNFKHLFKCLL